MKVKTPSRKTKKLVDQVFIPPRGWRMIEPTPLRRLWWKDKSHLMRFAEAVHFVELGDYKIAELGCGRYDEKNT